MTTIEAPPRTYATRGGTALAPARRPRPGPRPVERVAPAPRRHLRVVNPGDRVRRRLTPAFGVVATVILFVTLFLVAISHTVLVQGQVRLDALDAELAAEQARYQELRKEVAEMESPARIVAAAEALGMVSPDDLVYLQPTTPDSTTAPTGGEEVEPDAGASAGSPWSVMKPLLGIPTP